MKREYSNGYYPKIEYWTSKLMEAVNSKNLIEIDSCHSKLDYFIQRQWDSEVVVKSNTIAGVDCTQQLLELDEI